MSRLIETDGLTKRYGTRLAVNDLKLSLQAEGIIGLIGKNGAGKTSLLSMLSGALQATSGTIRILDQPAGAPELLGKINVLLQEASFKKGVAVNKQLVHFARLHGLHKTAAENEVARLLEQAGNTEYAHKAPETMSYGQRKRLGIIQAFIGRPELILLDEPTAGLDPIAASDIRRIIQDFADKTTFIISSHNLYELEDICSRIVVLDKGELKINTTLSELNQGSDCLHITLERGAGEDLLSALSQLPDIAKISVNNTSPEKISLYFTGSKTDKLQLQIQGLMIEHSHSVLQLNRSKNRLADILADVTRQN